jgi:hypothetical protein
VGERFEVLGRVYACEVPVASMSAGFGAERVIPKGGDDV